MLHIEHCKNKFLKENIFLYTDSVALLTLKYFCNFECKSIKINRVQPLMAVYFKDV